MSHQKSLGSDNHAGVHPKIIDAIARINQGSVHAYGEDRHTEEAVAKFREIFGPSVEVFFVFNGTAANVLGLKALVKPHHSILCAENAHLNTDECGAPEAAMGCKLISLPDTDGKLTSESLEVAERVIAECRSIRPHRVVPRVLSITQSTELGTVYTVQETRALAEFAHRHQLYLHMDGARIANAAAALKTDLKEITADAGVDVLSFGGTKNGLLAGEAVLFFRPELASDFSYLRKQSMQLASKMRFLSVQFHTLLNENLWLENARHANQMAALLARESAKLGVKITRKTEANAVFAILPPEIIPKLQEKWHFYVWNEAKHEVRWVCSFNTCERDILDFVSELKSALAAP